MRAIAMVTGLTLGGWLLSGCAMSANAAAEDESEIVSCPKCETVWMKSTGRNLKGVQVYHFKREMRCSECDAMAMAYLEDGKAELRDCPTCRATLRAAKAAEPPSHLLHKHQ